MKCDLCSTPMPADAAFCPECGNKVETAPAPPPADEHLGGKTIVQTPKQHTSSKLEPGTEFAGRYMIERTIGAGGMGTVYLAQDQHNTEAVALKLINPALLADEAAAERLISEGLVTRKIRHPNVIAVHDVAKAGAQPYVTMEYLDGTSLRAWIGRQLSAGTEIAVETAAGLVNAILDGLQAAHNEGVIHRDLKPENVMLLGDPSEGDYRLKILDFGIAKAVSGSLLASSTSAAGTPLYMAPEQRTSPDAARAAADIYSLSRMFYEMLMDVLPDGMWQAPSEHRSDVPAGIDALLQKGLSNTPRARQQSVEDYRGELAAAFAAVPPKKQKPISPDPEPKRKPRPVNILDDPTPQPPPETGGWDAKKIGLLVGGGLLALIMVAFLMGQDDIPGPAGTTEMVSFRASTQEPLGTSWWSLEGVRTGNEFVGEIGGPAGTGTVTGTMTDPTHMNGRVIWPDGSIYSRTFHIGHAPDY